MDATLQLRLLRNLVSELQHAVDEGVNLERVDSLITRAERALRSFVLLLAAHPTDLVIYNCITTLQSVVGILNSVPCVLHDHGGAESYCFSAHIDFSGAVGRPRIVITHAMLDYFFSYGFSASSIAMLLQVSLSTVRRRMCEYDLRVRDLYSSISDSKLDRLITSIQHENPNFGYRMMQGYLLSHGHRVQQNRVRESMTRTDPEGVLSHWCTTIQCRCYSVSSPNALWHIDGHHKLMR